MPQPSFSVMPVLIIAVILSCYGCHQPSATRAAQAIDSIPAGDSVPPADGYERLLRSYGDVSFDTLHVFPDTSYGTAYRYAGRQLDSGSAMLLIRSRYPDDDYDPDYYACYKFRIDANRMGLITKTLAEYDLTSIKLFILDIPNRKITGHLELADIFGDAGDAMMRQTWLFFNEKKQLQSLQWTRYSYDHSADDANDTTIEITDQLQLLGFSKTVTDTLSSDSAALAKQFPHLLAQ